MSASRGRSPEARKRRAQKRAAILNQRRYERQHRPRSVDAAERRVVRLKDGRTGRLLSVPAQSSQVSAGAKARVVLQSGAVVSVPVGDLVVVA